MREIELKIRWVRRWGGPEKSLVRGNHDHNILYENNLIVKNKECFS